MDQFRSLLRMALAMNAFRLRLMSKQVHEITLADGSTKTISDVAVFDEASFEQLIGFLFPKFAEQKVAGGVITGTLQIPQVGMLKLIAHVNGAQVTIQMYMPAGDALYLHDLAQPAATLPPAKAAPAKEESINDMFKVLLPKKGVAASVGEPIASPAPKIPAPSFAMPEPPSSPRAGEDLPYLTQIREVPVKATPDVEAVVPEFNPAAFVAPEVSTPSPFGALASPPPLGEAPVFLDEPSPEGNPAVIPPPPSLGVVPGMAPVSVLPITPPGVSPLKMTSPVNLAPPINMVSPVVAPVSHVHDMVQASPAAHSTVPAVSAPVSSVPTAINFGSGSEAEGSVSEGTNPIDPLFTEMVKLKASDMHLTIGQPIVLRVHGDITRQGGEILTPEYMERLIMPTLPARNREEFAKINDTDYAYELRGVGRFRMNVFRDRNGVGAVMRHIPSQILTAEQLNLPPAIMNMCKLNKGLVLVTGPTGSGKSTTLAAMLDWINKNRKEHLLTIEDPIEFVHQQQHCLVNQREVHKHTGSFGRALKAALREDPDIILIGEMRDLETIAIAIETAETGHLVFGTLHTTTAMSTVDRIIDQFPADRQSQIRTMLASSLRGVVTQTLLKKKGGGRVAAHEILVVNDAVSAMVREGKIHMIANHMMTQKAEGNQLLNDSLFKLIAEGHIEPHEALFKAVDKNDFLLAAARKNIKVA